jgi:YD repeat-containing protein
MIASGPISVRLTLDSSGLVVGAQQRSGDGDGSRGASPVYGYLAGRLVSVRRASGGSTTYTYGGRGRISSVHGAGQNLAVTWDGLRVTTLAVGDPAQRYSLHYGAHSTEVLAPGASKPTLYFHDAVGRLTRIQQGSTTLDQRRYDAQGRLSWARSTDSEARYEWRGEMLTAVEARTGSGWARTAFGWDDLGRLTSVLEANGGVRRLRYEGARAYPAELVDETGATTKVQFRNGVAVKVIDADGVATRINERSGQLVATSGSASQRMTRQIPAGLADSGRSASAAALVRTGLDSAGRPAALSFGSDRHPGVTYGYDSYGRVVGTDGADGHYVFGYDTRGRVTTRSTADGLHRWVYRYDAGGRMTGVNTDCGSNRRAACSTSITFDSAGRITKQRGPGGDEAFRYDAAGRVQEMTTGRVTWQVTARTAAGRPTAIRGAGRTLVRFEYNRDGRIESLVSPGGGRTTYRYKAGDLVRLERGPISVSYEHDRAGRVTRAFTALGVYRYRYDDRGRLVSSDGPGRKARFTYDDLGRVATADQAAIRSVFGYDKLGRVTKVVKLPDDGRKTVTLYAYVKGRPVSLTQNGMAEVVAYGDDGRPSLVKVGDRQEAWTWGGSGQLQRVVTGKDTFKLGYSNNQLTKIDRNQDEPVARLTWRPRQVTVDVKGHGKAALTWNTRHAVTSLDLGEGSRPVSVHYDIDGEVVRLMTGDVPTAQVQWDHGIPKRTTTPSGALSFGCRTDKCEITSAHSGAKAIKLTVAGGALTSTTVGKIRTRFSADRDGQVSSAQRVGDGQPARFDADKRTWTGPRSSKLKAVFGTDDRFVTGVSAGPTLPAIPAVDSIPAEMKPPGLDVVMPDETMVSQLARIEPPVPALRTQEVGSSGWVRNLVNELAGNPSATVQSGPFVSYALPMTSANQAKGADWSSGTDVLSTSYWGATHQAMVDSFGPGRSTVDKAIGFGEGLLRGAVQFAGTVLRLLPLALAFFASTIFGAAELYVGALVGVSAAISCELGWGPCRLLVESAGVLLLGAFGRVVLGLAEAGGVSGGVAEAASEGTQISESSEPVTRAVLRFTNAGDRFCRLGRVLCYSAEDFPETAEPYADRLGRKWAVFKIDRDGAEARRALALDDLPTRPGLDRDEFPFAVTRQGGLGALVTYVSPAENRSAGALLGHSIRHLDNQSRFLFLITDLPAEASRTIDAFGGTLALGILAEARR